MKEGTVLSEKDANGLEVRVCPCGCRFAAPEPDPNRPDEICERHRKDFEMLPESLREWGVKSIIYSGMGGIGWDFKPWTIVSTMLEARGDREMIPLEKILFFTHQMSGMECLCPLDQVLEIQAKDFIDPLVDRISSLGSLEDVAHHLEWLAYKFPKPTRTSVDSLLRPFWHKHLIRRITRASSLAGIVLAVPALSVASWLYLPPDWRVLAVCVTLYGGTKLFCRVL